MLHLLLESIPISDPRFRWITKKYGKPASSGLTVAAYLESNMNVRSLNEQGRTEIYAHINEYVASALELTADEELIDVAASIGVPKGRLEAILRRLGWLGATVLTLEETGQLLGVTRERVRQLESQFLKALGHGDYWTPILRQSIAAVGEILPVSESTFSHRLQSAGVFRSPITLGGYLRALDLFGISAPFSEFEFEGQVWLSANPEIDQDMLLRIRTHAVKLTSRHGISNFNEVQNEMGNPEPSLMLPLLIQEVIEGTRNIVMSEGYWILPADKQTRNSLRNRLRKILAVLDPIAISHARELLEREERPERSLDITDDHISALARYYPEFDVENGYLTINEPLDLTEELSESEFWAVEQIRKDGGVSSFGAIEGAIVAAGGTRVTAAVTLRYSPVIIKPDRDTYMVAGTSIQDLVVQYPDVANTPVDGVLLGSDEDILHPGT